jgi:two-component system response regulator PhoP
MPPPLNLLLVEDDALLRESLENLLRLAGYEVTAASTGLEYYQRLQGRPFEVALIDLGLPDQAGEVLVEYTRRNTSAGIIVITANNTVASRIRCYSVGADLFLGKPIDPGELLAAVGSVAARAPRQGKAAEAPAQWRLSRKARCLTAPTGQTLVLTAVEAEFVGILMRAGGAVSWEALLEQIYGRSDSSSRHALEAVVYRLRRKLVESIGPPDPILAHYGKGYVFVGAAVEED